VRRVFFLDPPPPLMAGVMLRLSSVAQSIHRVKSRSSLKASIELRKAFTGSRKMAFEACRSLRRLGF
jgi:hypothetical protein